MQKILCVRTEGAKIRVRTLISLRKQSLPFNIINCSSENKINKITIIKRARKIIK
jgi:hypothetical protein